MTSIALASDKLRTTQALTLTVEFNGFEHEIEFTKEDIETGDRDEWIAGQFAFMQSEHPDLDGEFLPEITDATDFGGFYASGGHLTRESLGFYVEIAASHYALNMPMFIVIKRATRYGLENFSSEYFVNSYRFHSADYDAIADDFIEAIPSVATALKTFTTGVFGHDADLSSFCDMKALIEGICHAHNLSVIGKPSTGFYVFSDR